MIQLLPINLALTFVVLAVATDPRVANLNDPKGKAISSGANEVGAMEAGQLPRFPRPNPGQGYLESDSHSSGESFATASDLELRILRSLATLDPDQAGPSSHSQQVELQRQQQESRLAELRVQQQEESQSGALALPPSSHEMSRDIEMGSPARSSSLSEPSSPSLSSEAALSTLTPDQAQCLQCFQSCVGCAIAPERALAEYCEAGNGTCACGRRRWNCALNTTICCSFFSSFILGLGLLALRSGSGGA